MCIYTLIAHAFLRLTLKIVVTTKGITVISNLVKEAIRQAEPGQYNSEISLVGQRMWN